MKWPGEPMTLPLHLSYPLVKDASGKVRFNLNGPSFLSIWLNHMVLVIQTKR